jgi:thioredoxin 1
MIFDQDIINNNLPAVLIFGANWSGNAEMMHGIAERVADEYSDITNFYHIDVDKLPSITSFFGIKKIPTVILIRQGEIVNKINGLVSASKLRKHIVNTFSENDQ